ncbi:hypothetical protein TARUN_3752 [Trichoderma arundinaceum]|uniref:Uncharacterized protein n=1 Tax=Trichoderma arundinaceum TaxID=490622 RepID=A0A395NR99_TRIAR|nr:hypothetical protein TARUN_3752 [Trichoderma arundinaceum]
MVLGGLRRSRSLESLRKDLFHIITNTTEGIHFLSGSTILEDKDADKKLLAVLCPQEEFKATDTGIAHMSKLFIQCNKWLPVVEERDSDLYWAVVASSTSQIQGIELPPKMAKSLAFSLLRARQRWILRQAEPESSKSAIKTHFIAGLQRLLEQFEQQDKNPAIRLSREDREWKLTDREIRDACKARPMGPGKRMSRGRIALSFNSPHKLYPIGQISGAHQLETNHLGMVDSSVEKITPTEAVQALISRRLVEWFQQVYKQPYASCSPILLDDQVQIKLDERAWLQEGLSPEHHRAAQESSNSGRSVQRKRPFFIYEEALFERGS